MDLFKVGMSNLPPNKPLLSISYPCVSGSDKKIQYYRLFESGNCEGNQHIYTTLLLEDEMDIIPNLLCSLGKSR